MAQNKTLDITGMTCAACANRIEKGLKNLPGISVANVNFAMESATVTYDSKTIGITEVLKKIDQLGYSATEKHNRQESNTIKDLDIKHQFIRLVLSAIFAFPLAWPMMGHFSFTSFNQANPSSPTPSKEFGRVIGFQIPERNNCMPGI